MKRLLVLLAIALLLTTNAHAQGYPTVNIFSRAYDADYLLPGDIYRYELVVNSEPNTKVSLYFTAFGEVTKILDPRCIETYSSAATIVCEVKANEYGFDYVSFDIRAYTANEIGLAEACKVIRHKAYVENGSAQLQPVWPRCTYVKLPMINK